MPRKHGFKNACDAIDGNYNDRGRTLTCKTDNGIMEAELIAGRSDIRKARVDSENSEVNATVDNVDDITVNFRGGFLQLHGEDDNRIALQGDLEHSREMIDARAPQDPMHRS